MSAEYRRGRLEALRRLAVEGAAEGWAAVPALAALLVRIACDDGRTGRLHSDPFLVGWARGVVDVAEYALSAGPETLGAWVRRLVLDAELEGSPA